MRQIFSTIFMVTGFLLACSEGDTLKSHAIIEGIGVLMFGIGYFIEFRPGKEGQNENIK